MGEPGDEAPDEDEDDLPTGGDVLRGRQQFAGEPVRIPLDAHPEGELELPEGRVEFIEDDYGSVEEHLYDGYIRFCIDTEPAVHFLTATDESVTERRRELLESIVDMSVDNTASELAAAIGSDVGAKTVRRDLQRLADLVDEARYEGGRFAMPDSDQLWAFVIEARRRYPSD